VIPTACISVVGISRGDAVGVASEYSKSFVEGTGLYDAVVSGTESPVELLAKLGVSKQEKVVLVVSCCEISVISTIFFFLFTFRPVLFVLLSVSYRTQ
jgi:hypothetical protein